MVDLHQSKPALANEHVWLSLSRLAMCWRVTLASALVGMLGVLLIGIIGLADSNSANIFFGLSAVFFGILPAPIFGGLAALLGPWLKRFYPMSQGLLFGLMGAGACAIILFIIDGIDSALHPCPPTMGCFAPFTSALFVIIYAGLPLALMAGLGFVTAIRVSNSQRVAKTVFAALLIVTVLVFSSVQLIGVLRPLPEPRFEAAPGPVCGVSRDGEIVEVPC